MPMGVGQFRNSPKWTNLNSSPIKGIWCFFFFHLKNRTSFNYRIDFCTSANRENAYPCNSRLISVISERGRSCPQLPVRQSSTFLYFLFSMEPTAVDALYIKGKSYKKCEFVSHTNAVLVASWNFFTEFQSY